MSKRSIRIRFLFGGLWPAITRHEVHVRRFLLPSEKNSAAHRDAIVGPVVIVQVTLQDGRYIADGAQSGRIVLA